MKNKEMTRGREKTLILGDVFFIFVVQPLGCMHLEKLHKRYTINMFSLLYSNITNKGT